MIAGCDLFKILIGAKDRLGSQYSFYSVRELIFFVGLFVGPSVNLNMVRDLIYLITK